MDRKTVSFPNGADGGASGYQFPNPWPVSGYSGGVEIGNPGDQGLFNNQHLFTTQTVPEPSTWAMMIVGFAGLGFAGYRSAKAKTVAT
jgi:hypothetical protein